MSDERTVLLTEAVARVLSSFAARENATVEDVIALAAQLPGAMAGTDQPLPKPSVKTTVGTSEAVAAEPAVAIDQSVSDESVTCLCCGRSFTMLKRHLKAEHGLSEREYRSKFGLSDDHPLVAPNYSIRKAEYAKRIGLGKYARDDSAEQVSSPSV